MDKYSFLSKSNSLISSVSECIERFCQSHNIDSDILNNALLVADEVVSNIKKYSEGHSDAIKITCSMQSNSPKELVIEIADDGNQFNPLAEENPDLESPVENRDIGGLGIYLIKSLTAEQHYKWLEGSNYLLLTFKS
ncbi:ATP-binding protein [Kangiella sediminilitoris]|uniref:Histidine kinase/HSP90-like ATPase domain-containing protein n=1 Tax=Kangiella sediminilitoris TaxID=1144748 RepID=A0A1B3B8V8_9GAMM|nr:ATP-binding protein [Kangiella sediminilitoris]AOE49215.1 hypothetical protein KS2013_491 [Kangiella sediminilitoris]